MPRDVKFLGDRVMVSENLYKALSSDKASWVWTEDEPSIGGYRDPVTVRGDFGEEEHNRWDTFTMWAPPREVGGHVGGSSEALSWVEWS